MFSRRRWSADLIILDISDQEDCGSYLEGKIFHWVRRSGNKVNSQWNQDAEAVWHCKYANIAQATQLRHFETGSWSAHPDTNGTTKGSWKEKRSSLRRFQNRS